MDSKNEIKSYIKPSTFAGTVMWLAFAAMIASVVMGVSDFSRGKDAVARKFLPIGSNSGDYAYIDVVGVSNWLYNYDDTIYYTVEDAEGYLYTAIISDSTYNKMLEQQDYWNRVAYDTPMPQAYRLYGLVRTASSTVEESLAQSWDITVDEYEAYFGTMLLNSTASPASEGAAKWSVIGMFALMLWFILLLSYQRAASNAKVFLNELENCGELDQAAYELANYSNISLLNDSVRLSENYIFGKHSGIVIRYSDVIWCFKRIQRFNFVPVGEYLIINTLKKRNLSIAGSTKKKSSEINDVIMEKIYEKNPSALMGFTSENAQIYRQRIKEEKFR